MVYRHSQSASHCGLVAIYGGIYLHNEFFHQRPAENGAGIDEAATTAANGGGRGCFKNALEIKTISAHYETHNQE